MATLKKYNLLGDEIGEIAVIGKWDEFTINPQLLKEYIVALRKNRRQWSANTQTRAEVSHSNKKPHAQKGTGKARQGSLASPQYRGGGRSFGPRPKFDQKTKINRSEKRAVIRSLIASKLRDNRVRIIESIDMSAPKTKEVVQFLKKLSLDRGVLFMGDVVEKTTSGQHTNFRKSVSNIPCATFCLAANINGYDLANSRDLVMTERALEELNAWLGA